MLSYSKFAVIREPNNDDNIGDSLANALERAIASELIQQQRNADDMVNLAVAAEG